jgi:hypothetical protein
MGAPQHRSAQSRRFENASAIIRLLFAALYKVARGAGTGTGGLAPEQDRIPIMGAVRRPDDRLPASVR